MFKEKIAERVKQHKTDNEIYHDLMQFKIREILLVATIYDAFILEEEDKLTEKIFGEYNQLNLSTAPRITSVSLGEEALEILKKRSFDMVILTMRIYETTPFELSKKIKELHPSIPILLLMNDNAEIALLKEKEARLTHLDKIFVWNGDSKIFLAMIKYVEDKINVVKDSKIGHVRVILLVEDSIRYYSRYLPTLYSEIMQQTQRIIADEHLVEIKKLLRMRARPKVLMASSYEEAISIFEEYKDNLLCIISDVKFPKGGVKDEQAGLKLISYVRSQGKDIPTLLQSFDPANQARAYEHNSYFLNKNSSNLSGDLREFIFNYLGFGDFVFRDSAAETIARASTMEEFKKLLAKVPDESLVYHANRNHFSSWLMARGEIRIAKKLQPVKVSDFSTYSELREHLIDVCRKVDEQKTRGKVIQFSESILNEKNHLIRLSEGALGGKGRGMAFLHMLIQNCDLDTMVPSVDICIPQTWVIGTEEYDYFIEKNGFEDLFNTEEDYRVIKRRALKVKLSAGLRKKLRALLKQVGVPLSVRSSGLLEDSLSQPFAGIYDTYLIPNNHQDLDRRVRNLEDAIKLVYASIFSKSARSYFDAINYTVSEEKMAILLQGVVGNQYGDRYYPHFSGVAQSYNYYPVAYLTPDDGIAVIGFGLGKYVIDGEKAHRFCPKHPKLDFIAMEDQIKNSQESFYAIDMRNNHIDLSKGDDATLIRLGIKEAEQDKTLEYCASVWDRENNRIQVGTSYKGPKILNFAYIVKYDYFPLAQTLEAVLEIIKSAMGTPVEIEFAVNLNKDKSGKPGFYILQIKPLLGDTEDFSLDLSKIKRNELFLYTEKAMGNGKVDDVCDIIYVDPHKFDKTKTLEMTTELEYLNKIMREENRRYILIGPGRWGSRDRSLGIPVAWSHISYARIIVEVELEDFRVDPSLGSHFFHNVTSMNIGYFDIPFGSNNNFIDWDWLKGQRTVHKTKNFVHVRLDKPVLAKMDGRKSISVIYK